MSYLNPVKCGLLLGALIGFAHMVWALLVVIGWAQPVVDFIFQVHFLAPAPTVTMFDLSTAAIQVAIGSAAGFLLGYGIAFSFNGALEREM